MRVSRVEVLDAQSALMYTLGAMPQGWRRTLAASTILAIAGVLILGASSVASAHVRPASVTEALGPLIDVPEPAAPLLARGSDSPAPPAPAALWLMFVLTLVLGLAIVAPRRTLVLVLVLVLGILAIETGVHSVHHLGDRQAAADCAVASATAHMNGATEPTPPDVTRVPTPVESVPLFAVERPGRRPSRPDEGRAPPAA
jgi:hypothetical protein